MKYSPSHKKGIDYMIQEIFCDIKPEFQEIYLSNRKNMGVLDDCEILLNIQGLILMLEAHKSFVKEKDASLTSLKKYFSDVSIDLQKAYEYTTSNIPTFKEKKDTTTTIKYTKLDNNSTTFSLQQRIRKRIKNFFTSLAASLILFEDAIFSRPSPESSSSPNKIAMVVSEKRYQERSCTIDIDEEQLKEAVGMINYLNRKDISDSEKEKFIELLKKGDIRAKKITRNYSTLHPTPFMKDDAFLKVYSPNKTSFYSSKGQKKELEQTVIKILLDNGVNVPKLYCIANIYGLNSIIQERIRGVELTDFITKNTEQKDETISATMGQLAKIHYHLRNKEDFKKIIPFILETIDYTNLFIDGFLKKIKDASAIVLQGSGSSLLTEEGKEYEIKVKCEDKTSLIEAFRPISKEISKLEQGVYIDSNPANILIDSKGKIYNVDFENVKVQPFQFDLAILSAGLGLSEEEQTRVVDEYLKHKSKLESKEHSEKEKRDFHRGYNLISILRNLTLAGNMQDYILKYNEKKALEDQLRYIRQAKQAIDRALNSDVMSEEDKTMITRFKQAFENYEVTHLRIEPNPSSTVAPLS